MIKLKKQEILKKLVKGVIKGYSHSLIAVSPAGHGKTETVIKTLEEFNLKEGKEYLYINSYITPLELYKQLEEVNDLREPKILVLDDCEDILNNLKLLSLMKGCLWPLPNGLRKVSWFSTSPKTPTKTFYFEGKIILLLNRMDRNNSLINAVADRGFYFKFKLSNSEIIEMMRERIKQPYPGINFEQRKKILEFIVNNLFNSKNLSLRTLSQAFSIFKMSPNHFQELLREIIK